MKAIIDEDGELVVERSGKMKSQGCVSHKCRCGDWCPAFHEPEEQRGWKNENDNYPRFVITLCNTVGDLFFDELDDQRGK